MPNLQHNATFERHMTLASMAQCPRAWWHNDRIRRGVEPDRVAGESLMVGIGVHAGLAHLWGQRRAGTQWLASLAMDAIKGTMPGMDKKIVTEAEKAVADYALQWTGVRDHWVPRAIEPNAQPPAPWTVLEGKFVACASNSEPGTGTGRARPLASGGPSSIRWQIRFSFPSFRCSRTGAARKSIRTPSASAASTSSIRHGISRRVRR